MRDNPGILVAFLYIFNINIQDNVGNLVELEPIIIPVNPRLTCTPDKYEPNYYKSNGAGFPTTLPIPTKIDANFCEVSDNDYYQFNIDTPTNVTILITSNQLIYFQVNLVVSGITELITPESGSLKFTRLFSTSFRLIVLSLKNDPSVSYSLYAHTCTNNCPSNRIINVFTCSCDINNATSTTTEVITDITTSPIEEEFPKVESTNKSNVTTIVGSVLGVFVGMGIIGLVAFLLYKKKRNNQYGNNAAIELGSSTSYIQDTTVHDVVITGQIGAGNFSEVYKGTMKGSIPVALKRLKNIEAYHEFVKEQEILQSLQHKNIVHFYGTYYDPKMKDRYLVMEFLSKGSVQSLLQDQNNKLSFIDLVSM